MIPIDWKNLPIEYYIIAALAVFCFVLIILLLIAGKKIRNYKSKSLADQIDLEESGKHEKWFSVFTKTIPQVFWIRGDGITHFVSPQFEKLTGHNESLINDFPTRLLEICHPEDLQGVKNAHTSFIQQGNDALDINFRINKSGSQYVWIRERIYVHTHFSGEKFHVGIFEDITDKQLIIEEVRDQKLLLDNVLASTDEGIFCLNRNLQFLYWNAEMESITGMTTSDIGNGKTIFEVFPHLQENGSAESIRQALEGKGSDFETYPYHLKNNRKGFTESKHLPLSNSKGDIIGIIGIVKDISEEMARDDILEETQERYGHTLRAVDDGIWDWNILTDNFIFSDRWFDMLGYNPSELAASKDTILSLLATDYDKDVVTKCMNDLSMGETADVEVQMNHKDGYPVWVQIRGKCTELNSDGKALRALGTQSDITVRKNNELALIKAKDKAEESDKLKSAFLANMSHEIRTPLNAIVGFTELITSEEEPTPEDKILSRNQIRKNSEGLLSLVNDIILLSTIESEQYIVQKDVFELISLMKTTAKDTYKIFGKEKADEVGLKLQIPPGTTKLLLATDEKLLQSSIWHLLKNALNYTKTGQVTMGFKIIDDKVIEIFVQDTGIGIKQQDLRRIFKQFEQLEQSLSRTHDGTGLGLSLTKKMVHLLGGEIHIESEPGVGSKFLINLPYQTP